MGVSLWSLWQVLLAFRWRCAAALPLLLGVGSMV